MRSHPLWSKIFVHASALTGLRRNCLFLLWWHWRRAGRLLRAGSTSGASMLARPARQQNLRKEFRSGVFATRGSTVRSRLRPCTAPSCQTRSPALESPALSRALRRSAPRVRKPQELWTRAAARKHPRRASFCLVGVPRWLRSRQGRCCTWTLLKQGQKGGSQSGTTLGVRTWQRMEVAASF